jgi:hypothetical protein
MFFNCKIPDQKKTKRLWYKNMTLHKNANLEL